MLAGTPVISRDCGGAREIIDNGLTGKILPNLESNEVELSHVLGGMTTGSNWRAQLDNMGAASRVLATHEFSYVRMAREFSNVIAERRYFGDTEPI